jgi:hypothetical protein
MMRLSLFLLVAQARYEDDTSALAGKHFHAYLAFFVLRTLHVPFLLFN